MPNVISSEYNSQKPLLTISEYGRSVQDLVDYAKTIENPEQRQKVAEYIIEIMRIVNPQKSAFEDVTDKLWKHFFRIANYEIDVTPPFGEKPTKPDLNERPSAMEYPVQEVRFRHYGHNIQVLIRKALEMEPGEVRDELVNIIGSYMKLAYKTWNREHYVSDDLIKADLELLSGHKLSLEEGVQFDTALAPVDLKNGTDKGYRRGKYQNRNSRNRRSNTNYGKGRSRRR
jgi:hypothetical protein